MLGARHFTFYNSPGMAPNFIKMLEEARTQGISIDVLPWNGQSDKTSLNKVHELNQYMAINSCIYWHMPYFKYSAVVDLDEYITYRHGEVKYLTQLLEELELSYPQAGAFLFKHYLLTYKEDSGGFDIFQPAQRYGPLGPRFRSKVICVSDRIITSTIHDVGEMVNGSQQIIVSEEDAALYHFRKRPIGNLMENSTDDFEMMKYESVFNEHRLTARFMEVRQKLQGS
jgi:hypothetical protein